MAGRTNARAVFHDRTALEEAIRALELEGVPRRRIHVYRADSSGAGASGEGVHLAPERSAALRVSAGIGALAGVALALLSLVFSSIDPLPIALLLARVVAGAGAGALLGGVLAIVTERLRNESRYEQPTGYKDYVVQVDALDRAAADDVRDLLERAGGDPMAI